MNVNAHQSHSWSSAVFAILVAIVCVPLFGDHEVPLPRPGSAARTSIPEPAAVRAEESRGLETEALGERRTWTTGQYHYDGSGNVAAIDGSPDGVTVPRTSYEYDRLRRLTRATAQRAGAITHQDYTYDAFGNLTSIIDRNTSGSVIGLPRIHGVDSRTNTMTDPAPCLRAGGSVSCYTAEYDTSGNVKRASGVTYEWDNVNVLTQLTRDAVPEVYLYTVDDERVATVTASATRYWRYTLRGLDAKVLREFRRSVSPSGTETWAWEEDWIHAGGRLLASARTSAAGPAVQHYHVDHLGSPRLMTDAEGREIAQLRFEPFGEEPADSDRPAIRLKFTGHERDDAGSFDARDLDYMHARYYSASWGRFLSVDPVMDIKSNVSSPQGWSRYAYARNNPMLRVDPDGRKDKVFVVAALEAKYTMQMQRMLNAELKGTPYAGRVEVIGPSASRGQMLLTLRNADSSDIVIIASHGGRSPDAAGGGNIGTLFKGQRQITSGATMAQWTNDGSAPKAVILAGCCTNQTAQTITSTAGSETLGTNHRTMNDENQPGAVAATGVLARGGTIQDAATAANQHIKTDGGCGRNPGCDPNQPARFEANPPR